MDEDVEPYLLKARACLAGARSELANGRYNNAANRAYYAAHNAAIVALIRAGVARPCWTHDEVQALFAGQLVTRRKLYSGKTRRALGDLMIAHLTADYGKSVISRAAARTHCGAPKHSGQVTGV